MLEAFWPYAGRKLQTRTSKKNRLLKEILVLQTASDMFLLVVNERPGWRRMMETILGTNLQ